MKNKEIKVRGYHLDQFGHVNNVRYPEMLEEARYHFFDQFPGFFSRVEKAGFYLPLTHISIHYKKSSFLDDILDIRTRIASLGETKVTIHQTISIKGTDRVILEADVVSVAVSIKTGKRASIEGDLRAELESIIQACGE
ncbi:MAG: thioesterase [Deltaproteobacteria bacterium HGW-Deltaproteobacteria-10]|nr:MAG: thioesterase [Deltaproteobacteria bacterium HGW-Deltaproteobacteria-10]